MRQKGVLYNQTSLKVHERWDSEPKKRPLRSGERFMFCHNFLPLPFDGTMHHHAHSYHSSGSVRTWGSFETIASFWTVISSSSSAALRTWEVWVSCYSSTFGFFQTFGRKGTWLKLHSATTMRAINYLVTSPKLPLYLLSLVRLL